MVLAKPMVDIISNLIITVLYLETINSIDNVGEGEN